MLIMMMTMTMMEEVRYEMEEATLAFVEAR